MNRRRKESSTVILLKLNQSSNCEAAAMAALTGGQAEGKGDMGLAGAAVAQ